MPIGQNVPLGDKLIKKTTIQPDTAAAVPAKNTAVSPRVPSPAQPAFRAVRNVATSNTVKMTFYVKQELLEQLYNYAYWDRLTVTEAFNTALSHGLKDKKTTPRKA